MKNAKAHRGGVNTENEQLVKDQYLNQLVSLLVEFYDPVKIYLFGSKARGDQGPHSDYDLMVVVRRKVPWTKRKKFHDAKWSAGLREATDIILWSAASFEEQQTLKASLPATVMEEGKLRYEAA